MGKSTISTAIFNSKLLVYQRVVYLWREVENCVVFLGPCPSCWFLIFSWRIGQPPYRVYQLGRTSKWVSTSASSMSLNISVTSLNKTYQCYIYIYIHRFYICIYIYIYIIYIYIFDIHSNYILLYIYVLCYIKPYQTINRKFYRH